VQLPFGYDAEFRHSAIDIDTKRTEVGTEMHQPATTIEARPTGDIRIHGNPRSSNEIAIFSRIFHTP
jgi:hypothetical protein